MAERKHKLIFFDTETTGNGSDDRLCQIAYKCEFGQDCQLFKPPQPISIDAMTVHHITNKMVADKPPFKYSACYAFLMERASESDSIFVAHNAAFDLSVIKREGIVPTRHICTLKVARALDSDGKIPSLKLQYLRYMLDLELDVPAHDAMGDVIVLEKIYQYLESELRKKHSIESDAAIEMMMEISQKPSLIRSINFGKHKGKTVAEVAKEAPDYLEWLYNEKKKNPADEADWLYTLEYYLR